MASAGTFLRAPSWRRRKKNRVDLSPPITSKPNSSIHMPRLPNLNTQGYKGMADHRILDHRPNSRGHTINGTEKELAFHRARACLRLMNNETPSVDNSIMSSLQKSKPRPNFRTYRRKRPRGRLPPAKLQQKSHRRQHPDNLKGMINEVWSLQANKPQWLVSPGLALSEETKLTPIQGVPYSASDNRDLFLELPNSFEDPKTLMQVHKTLQLHPSASHIEKSLLELHLQGAVNAHQSPDKNRTQITSWLAYKYPLLLQRDTHRENKAITTISRAFRAFRSRCAFRAMVNIQRERVKAARCIEQCWISHVINMARRREAKLHAAKLVSSTIQNAMSLALTIIETRRQKSELIALRALNQDYDRLSAEKLGRSQQEAKEYDLAARKIQAQWRVFCWRLRNDIFLMFRRTQDKACCKIQKFVRGRLQRIRHVRQAEAEKAAILWQAKVRASAAQKIQRLVLRVRGQRWRQRMRYGIDVRDLLGADEDLPFEYSEIVAKVRDFFLSHDFGKPESMDIAGTARKYYTGGVWSQIGVHAPGRNLTNGERSLRLFKANVELASVEHSVGRLEESEATWQKIIEERLLQEWKKSQIRKEANDLEEVKEIERGDGFNSTENITLIEKSTPTGIELFEKLTAPPVKYSELGSGKELSGVVVTLLIHLMLVYQCRGQFERAERLLHYDILGKEYDSMVKKVGLADIFRRRMLLKRHIEIWKKAVAEFLWKRQHALKKFREAMQSLEQRIFSQWGQWGRAVLHWRRQTLLYTWTLWHRWMKDRRNMLRLLGESDEHNVISIKRRVMRRWFFQIREWRRQRNLIKKSFDHGRIIVLLNRLQQWKDWRRNIGHPWWVAQKFLCGQFFYWEEVVRDHFNWLRRVVYLEKSDYVAWATITMQKYIRGKWGRKRAQKLSRMLALHRHKKKEWEENMVIWTVAAKRIQVWYRGFLRIRRLGRISIQLREQAEDRRLRLRKLRLQIKYLKSMIRLLGVEPKEFKDQVEDCKKYKERAERVVRSSALRFRNAKKVMQKVIIQYGEAKVKMRCDEMEHELRLEGAASKLTEKEIEKSIKRNHQYAMHQGQMERQKAFAAFKRSESFQDHSKAYAEHMTDVLDLVTSKLEDYKKMDEEGQVREKIVMLSKFHEDSAASRIVALLRGNQTRLRISEQSRIQREIELIKDWGALCIQTRWRQFKSKRVANGKREQKKFHSENARILAVANRTGRPLGSFEQEKDTVALMAKAGITEEKLAKLESKMSFFINAPWKRRISEVRWNKLPDYVRKRVPVRNRPLPTKEIMSRKMLLSFFKDMHTHIKNFSAVKCPWRETSVYTFIKMKVAVKLVNAKCRFRQDGGIKKYSLYDLLPVVLERGGSLVSTGKPTYFPKMPLLSPQTWGIWKIPMEHPSEDFGNLLRATDLLLEMAELSTMNEAVVTMTNADDGDDGFEEEDISEMYKSVLEGSEIQVGQDYGLTGLIGGDVLGLTSDGMSVASYRTEGTDNFSGVFEYRQDQDDEVLSEEEEYPNIEMPLPARPTEVENLEDKALDILASIRHTNPKKKQRRMLRILKARERRRKGNEANQKDDSGDVNHESEMPLRPMDKDGVDLFDDTISDISSEKSDVEQDSLDGIDVADMDMEQLAKFEQRKIEKIRKEQEAEAVESLNKSFVHALPDCLACKVRNDIKRPAQRLCHDCNLPYCISCYRLSHKTGRPRHHHYTKYEHRVEEFHEEDSRKKAHYKTAYLKFLSRTNPEQYRRQLAITDFEWSDVLLRQAGQLFLELDWQDAGEIDMPQALSLIRTLLKRRKDEVPSMRVALKHTWLYLQYPDMINFTEFVNTMPVFMRFFRHDALLKLKVINQGEEKDIDPSIFI